MIRLPLQCPRPAGTVLVLLATVACPWSSRAQGTDSQLPPAHISYVDGRVLVESDAGSALAEESTPVVPGDRVRTEDGRAELLFGDGSRVQFDGQTSVDLLSDARLRLLSGRLALVTTSAQAGRLQIDTPQGSVAIRSAGEFRVLLFDDEGRATVELSVIRGSADLASDRDRVTVDAGERSWARLGEAPAYPVRFNAAAMDAFDQWALDRAGASRTSASVRYVPTELHAYADVLDTYGAWGYQPTYGYVWYPRVAAGWRPYYAGRWHFYGRFGWTWVGGGSWGWATHHYGRWGVSTSGAWFWIPGGVWGPAWVSWAVAPGYVSWCPLGYDNRAVVGFWGGGAHGHHGGYGHGYDPWHAWTVIPRDHFGGYRAVSAAAVDGARFATARVQPGFVLQDRAPRPPRGTTARGSFGVGAAVPRSAASTTPAVGTAPGVPRYTAGASGPASSAPANPIRGRSNIGNTAGPSSASDGGAMTRQAGPIQRTPEDLARASRLAAPRNPAYAGRLPGDISSRPRPTSPGTTAVAGAVSTLPGSRGHGFAAPRSAGPSAGGWSPDQVPVHRGMRLEPDAGATAPPSVGSTGMSSWRGDRVQPPARAGVAVGPDRGLGSESPATRSWGSPGLAMPRGAGVPVGPRYAAPSGMPASRGAAPSAAPAAPPPAAPRQAPATGGSAGTAAPRGGAPPAHHR